MTKFIAVHGGELAKKLFANTLSESIPTWQVNETDSLKYLMSGSEEDWINWLVTQSEEMEDRNKVIILDEFPLGCMCGNETETYYINLTEKDGGNEWSDFYDTTININNLEELHTKINILLR